MVEIIWTQLAVNDLKEIHDYIAKDSKRYAGNQIKRIRAKTSILKSNPLVGRIVPELEISQIRELIEGNYRIIYKIRNRKTIEILTIHHSARDFSSREIM